MVTLTEKKRMRQFTGDRLEAGNCTIVKELPKGLLVQDSTQNIMTAVHFFAGDQTKDEARDYLRNYANNGLRAAFVLYKDGKTACVRLGIHAINRAGHSLKNYTTPELNAMINLRDLEKIVLAKQKGDEFVTYYSPQSALIPQSLRTYGLEDVWLDRSHITRNHPAYGFVKSETSTDFKIAVEVPQLAVTAKDPARLIFSPTYASIVK